MDKALDENASEFIISPAHGIRADNDNYRALPFIIRMPFICITGRVFGDVAWEHPSLIQYSVYAILQLVSLVNSYYSKSLQQEILEMPAGFLGRYLRYTDRMEIYGPDLGMPHTRAMGEGLFELRLKATVGIARVFYCTLIGKHIVMLHQFIKKSNKTPSGEIIKARRRMKEIKYAYTQRT